MTDGQRRPEITEVRLGRVQLKKTLDAMPGIHATTPAAPDVALRIFAALLLEIADRGVR